MLYDIGHVHLELSSLCNARCPFCPRNYYGYPHNFGYTETNLALKDVEKIFNPRTIAGIKGILINGNFGDFVMNTESPDVVEYFLQHNKDLKITVNTNGSAGSRQFWERLGRSGITVFFSVDGLEDTNHLYRQDTSFNNIMRNARYFIDAGGSAHWKMIKFQHNQKDRGKLHKLAADMGFVKVWMMDTVRDQGPAFDRYGNKTHVIDQDDHAVPQQISTEWIEQASGQFVTKPASGTKSHISCQAKRDQSIYVSADGHVYPCCWVGFNPRDFRPMSSQRLWNQQISPLIDHNHAPTVGLEKAVEWFHALAHAWGSDQQPDVCQRFCGEKQS